MRCLPTGKDSILLPLWTLSLWSLATTVLGQQFDGYPIPFEYPGMRDVCKAALNTKVNCHPIFPRAAPRLPRLNQIDLEVVCTSDCLNSLKNAKPVIASACVSTDIMTVRGVDYPATYLVDYFIYAHGVLCRKDATTQQFCAPLVTEWTANDVIGKECADCILGGLQQNLNSPFGYQQDIASAFVALTSSCSKSGYAFTSPSPYAIPTSTASGSSSASTFPPSCVAVHTTAAGDTCDSIAVQRNVSSYAVYGPNGIRDCENLQAGKIVCLLGQCRRYKVRAGDTCDGIIQASGIQVDAEVFTALNPNIDPECTNLARLVGQEICLSYSEGILLPKFSTDHTPNNITKWPPYVKVPEAQLPLAPGTLSGCLQFRNYRNVPPPQDPYYTPSVQRIDDIVNQCSYIVATNNIDIDHFKLWNPSLQNTGNRTGCGLSPGFSYCVDHPTKPPPRDLDGCQRDVPQSIIPTSIRQTCGCLATYLGSSKALINCQKLADANLITVVQLKAWNPWIGSDCDVGIWANLMATATRAFCVNGNVPVSSTTSGSSKSSSTTTSTTASPIPSLTTSSLSTSQAGTSTRSSTTLQPTSSTSQTSSLPRTTTKSSTTASPTPSSV